MRAATDVVRWLVCLLLRLAVCVELFRGAVAVVRLVLGQQLVGDGAVPVETLHLPVRPERALRGLPGDFRTLVPFHAQPVQLLEDVALIFESRASLVGVLEPQNEGAAHALREQVVVERRPSRAEMERPGWTRRDADADCHRTDHGRSVCGPMAMTA